MTQVSIEHLPADTELTDVKKVEFIPASNGP
jgi:hypothetical protein